MNWIITENNRKINALDIPTASIEEIKSDVEKMKMRVIGFFGKQEFENVRLYVVLADDKVGKIYVTSSLFPPDVKSYESFTQKFPAFHIFEREFYEEFGIEPLNHPWLKPVRVNQDKYPFFEMQGEDIHQVAVGPIHAGVIEPGHFRFMCMGEKVYDLEIMLGYQHRGVEDLFLKNRNYNNRLAESVCGDTVIGYNMAYSQAMETLSDTKISNKAQIIRRVALEMERIAIHIGDMGAISGDIAYLMGAAVFGAYKKRLVRRHHVFPRRRIFRHIQARLLLRVGQQLLGKQGRANTRRPGAVRQNRPRRQKTGFFKHRLGKAKAAFAPRARARKLRGVHSPSSGIAKKESSMNGRFLRCLK